MKEYLLDLPLYLLYLSLWESKLPMKEKKYGSEYVNRELGTHIEKQMRILEVLLVKTLPKDKKLLNVIIPLFHSILDSCDSLILLSQRPKGKFPKIRDFQKGVPLRKTPKFPQILYFHKGTIMKIFNERSHCGFI